MSSEGLNRVVSAHQGSSLIQEVGHRSWMQYKKRFGASRNAVSRNGFGPEFRRTEKENSNQAILARRKINNAGPYGIPNTSADVLQRKYTGGILTRQASQLPVAPGDDSEAAEAAAAGAAEEGKNQPGSKM